MKVPLQCQLHVNGTNSDTSTSRLPDKHAHSSVDHQVSKATQTVSESNLLTVLPGPSSSNANETTHSCSPSNTPSSLDENPRTTAIPSTTVLQVVMFVTRENQTFPPRAFVPTDHQPVEPRLHEGLSIPLSPPNPLDGDPWSPEYVHAFPSSVRRAELQERLNDFDYLMDIQSNMYVAPFDSTPSMMLLH